jgi:ABC-type branched-subunit amino acid transport system substrate-binding protein
VIYDRLASTYLEMNLLSHAKRVTLALMESTEDDVWYYRGMALLEMIEQAFSGEKFVVGCLLPLSGPFALYGQKVLNGMELALDPFGDSEHAAMIELVIEDTGGTADGALAAIERLILRKGLIVVVGPLASKAAVAAAKRANELQVPIITLTQKEGIVMEGEFVYRSFLTPSMEVSALANHAIFEMGFRNFAILYPNNSYGQVLMDLFWEQVDSRGGKITAVESYPPKETDFALQIKKLVGLHYPRPKAIRDMMKTVRAKRAEEIIDLRGDEEPFPIVDFDAVFIPDNVQHIALIAPHFPFYSVFDIRLLGTSLWQSEELIKLSGEHLQGAVFPTGFYPLLEEEKVRLFVEKYTDVFEETPGVLAATGYDTVSFIKNLVIERAIRTSQELQEGLSQAASYEGVTGRFSFDASGEVEKNPLLLTVMGKDLKPILPQQRQPSSDIAPSYTSIDAP